MLDREKTAKLPSLDGWRAVSIILVLTDHSCHTLGFPSVLEPVVLEVFATGTMGVHFFFVISGFLITYLLLEENARRGGISLKHFYLRRALRILPVYFFYLLILGLLTRFEQPARAWLINATFTTNFFDNQEPVQHLWSLAVEEQFYLLWPGLLVLLLRWPGRWVIPGVLMIPLLMAPVMRMLACKGWYPQSLEAFFCPASFLLRCDALAFGCLAALLFTRHHQTMRNWFERNFTVVALAGPAMILTPALFHLVHIPERIQEAGRDTLWALGFALLMVQSVFHSGAGPYRWLNAGWVRHIGVLSYSVYIWQQMFFGSGQTLFGVKDAWWTCFPAWILAALLAAHVSYYLLERPLLGLRQKLR